MGQAGEAAARALIGARFRLHGRDAAGGADCVGVAAAALRADGWAGALPTGYALRAGARAAIAAAVAAGLEPVARAGPGDVLLYDVGGGQLHFAVRSAGGIIHADAGLRRVVERPGLPAWRLIGAWRHPKGE